MDSATPRLGQITPAQAEVLRGYLQAARWNNDHVAALLGEVAARALARGQRVAAQRALRRIGPAAPLRDWACAALTRLFMLGEDLDFTYLEGALPGFSQTAFDLGLVQASGEATLRAAIDLRPHEVSDEDGREYCWWIASDLGNMQVEGALAAEHVPGLGGATFSLLRFMDRRPVEDLLDLGTGCGIIALHATTFARRVCATDISARALAFARFNALLNDIPLAASPQEDGLYLQLGSLFEPLAGRAFDRIVTNPPFVITPAANRESGTFTYRDGGAGGDQLVATLIDQAPRYLRPGGNFQCLLNWEVCPPQAAEDKAAAAPPNWATRVAAWLEGAQWEGHGARAYLSRRESQDPCEYAEMWLRDAGTPGGRAGYEAAYAAYLEDFASRQVQSIDFGYLYFEKEAAPGGQLFFLATSSQGQSQAPTAAAGRQSLDLEQEIAGLDLLNEHLVLHPEVREYRINRPGSPDIIGIEMHCPPLAWRAEADTVLAATLGACDGELSLGQIAAALASLLEADAAELTRQLLPQIPPLLRAGVLSRA